MGTRFSVGMNRDGARPELTGPRACTGNGRRTGHTRRLRGIQIQLPASDDTHAVIAPVDF